jgi:CRP/FNR family transcriptional regulator
VAAGHPIFWEGDDAGTVHEVRAGVIKLSKTPPDGRCQVTGFAYPGSIIGLSFGGRFIYSAEAVTAAEIVSCSRPQFQDLLRREPDVASAYWAQANDELVAAQEQLLILGRMNATERVATFLSHLLDAAAGEDVIRLPMTRNAIADYLGLTTETVSRTFTRLRREGVVVPINTHDVRVKDASRLRSLAAAQALAA